MLAGHSQYGMHCKFNVFELSQLTKTCFSYSIVATGIDSHFELLKEVCHSILNATARKRQSLIKHSSVFFWNILI